MLILRDFIGKGATRLCFAHPSCSQKCVKIVSRSKDAHLLEEELRTYSFVKTYLNEYIPEYDRELVDTNFGKGLVCELLKDDDGMCSKTLGDYCRDRSVVSEIVGQLWHFAYCLAEHDIFFYDFNMKNFVVQRKNGKLCLRFIDLKSYNKYKSWMFLRLEKVVTPLARYLMLRRLKRLFSVLGTEV